MSPSEKLELWVSVLTGQPTQREAAERDKVHGSTAVHISRLPSRRHPRTVLGPVWLPDGRAGLACQVRSGSGLR